MKNKISFKFRNLKTFFYYYKGNPPSYNNGVEGESGYPWHLIPWRELHQIWESLNIPRNPKI